MADDPARSIDEFFPPHHIHLIFGPSGVGKTIFGHQLLDDWRGKRPILDEFAAVPDPPRLCYVSVDKPAKYTEYLRKSLGIPDFPHVSLVGTKDISIEVALRAAASRVAAPQVVFVDGFLSLCTGKSNDYQDVSKFLMRGLELVEQFNTRIIGQVLASKTSGNGFVRTYRERILGASSLASGTGSKVMLDFYKTDPQDLRRRVVFLPWDAAPWEVYLEHGEGGRLIPSAPDEESSIDALDEWLASLVDDNFDSSDALLAGAERGLKRRSVFKWLKKALDLGFIRKVDRGKYQRASAPTI